MLLTATCHSVSCRVLDPAVALNAHGRVSSANSPINPLPLIASIAQDVGIGAEPVRLLDELSALDLEHLDPAAALVIGGAELERRNETTEREVVDRLKALLYVLAGRLSRRRWP